MYFVIILLDPIIYLLLLSGLPCRGMEMTIRWICGKKKCMRILCIEAVLYKQIAWQYWPGGGYCYFVFWLQRCNCGSIPGGGINFSCRGLYAKKTFFEPKGTPFSFHSFNNYCFKFVSCLLFICKFTKRTYEIPCWTKLKLHVVCRTAD